MQNPNKKTSRWSTLTYRLALLIAALLGISAILTTTFAVKTVQDSLYEEVTQSMLNVHNSVATTVALEYEAVQAYREATLQSRRASLESISAPIVSSLDQLVLLADRGELTQEQARSSGLDLVRDVRFGNDDYFFVYNRDLVAIGHPDPQFQGQFLGDMQDPNGQFVVRDLAEIAFDQGSGFYSYEWVRLGQGEPSPKIAYVFHYTPWDWMIGTGVYVDDIDQAASDRLDVVKSQLGESLYDIRFSEGSVFFVLDSSGEIVVAPSDQFGGSPIESTDEVQRIGTSIIASAPTTAGVVSEQVVSATLRDGVAEEWVTNVSAFPNLGWYLLSAVPASELSKTGQRIAIEQAIMGVVVLILGIGAGLLLSRRIIRPVQSVTNAARELSEDRFDPDTLNQAAERKDEVGELARVFQRMGKELIERERKLREQVAKLKVQIDRSKLAEDIEEITETDYFKRIKAQADEMRKNKPSKETE